jgi:hypothetical protein
MNAAPPWQLYWRLPAANKHYNSYATAVVSANLSQVFTNCAFITTRPAWFVATNTSTVLTSGQYQPRQRDLVQLASTKPILNRPKPPSASPTYEQRWRAPLWFIGFAAICLCSQAPYKPNFTCGAAVVLLCIRIYHYPLKSSPTIPCTILCIINFTSYCIWIYLKQTNWFFLNRLVSTKE